VGHDITIGAVGTLDDDAVDDRRRAFEALYVSHYQGMVRFAHLLTGSKGSAEEVVQDAFVALYRRFDRVDNPAGYLRVSVVNGCRSLARRHALVNRKTVYPPPSESGAPEIDETWAALARLSPRRRAAVVLRYYADLPEQEIADVLGCRVGTVKSLLSRALGQLKQVIQP
jgi:RNA polymerase sigma-70 factor (sigma-E family)